MISKKQRTTEINILLAKIKEGAEKLIESDLDVQIGQGRPCPFVTTAFILEQYALQITKGSKTTELLETKEPEVKEEKGPRYH